MQLTLEVISPNGAALGPNRRKVVGQEGAQIGRAKENDWVILDQYISRVNAKITFMNGAFYVEGLGRNPLAMYDANNTVANNELHQLRDGDRFFLDQYEIRATLSTAPTVATSSYTPMTPQSPRPMPPLSEDPFANELPLVVPNAGRLGEGFGDVVIGHDGDSGSSNLDPLAVLGPTSKPTQPPRHIELDQGSVLDDTFDPPRPITKTGLSPVSALAPAGSARPTSPNGIPDDWLMDPPTRPQATPAPQALRRPQSQPVVIPETWGQTGFTQLEAVQRPAEPPKDPFAANDSTVVDEIPGQVLDPVQILTGEPQTPPVRPRPQAPQRVPVDPPSTQAPRPHTTQPHTTQPHAIPADVTQAHPPYSPPAHTTQPHSTPPSAELQSSLAQLLRAAGLPSAQMTPEIAAEIGEALRIVVQGVMDVLHSRAEIKSELRMAMTRMQPQENNPLKFSPNVEAALHTLLVERNRGYLPTTRAFEEAFNDIRNHQVAVLQGIRVAFESLLGQFKPEQIEAQMEAQGRRGGLLSLGAKARFRDHYGELFEQLTHDPDASFRRLFGEPFAQAYEAQMEHLALQASRSKRRE